MKKEIKNFNHERKEYLETNHEIQKVLNWKSSLKEKIERVKISVEEHEKKESTKTAEI